MDKITIEKNNDGAWKAYAKIDNGIIITDQAETPEYALAYLLDSLKELNNNASKRDY